MWLQKSYECSQHTVGKKELKRWQSFLCGSSQQQFITKTGLWSWQLSFHSGGAGRVWHGEAGKTIEKRVLLVSWVDCLLLGMPPGSEYFPALKLQGNKSLPCRTDLREAPGQHMRSIRSSDLAVRVVSVWPGRLQPLAKAGGWGGCQHDPGKRRVMLVKSLTPGASSQSGHP